MEDSDEEVLKRIRDGATDGFAEIVRRHQSQVLAILHRYERDPHLLEDLAQDTFLKAWRALDQFDGRAPFQQWLSRIAVNVARDHLSRQKRYRHEIGFQQLGDDALDWLSSDDHQLELQASTARELLDAAMRALSPAEQVVITLQELEGRSVREISHLTGSSGVAVRVRALRARAKLRKALKRLEDQCHEPIQAPPIAEDRPE